MIEAEKRRRKRFARTRGEKRERRGERGRR